MSIQSTPVRISDQPLSAPGQPLRAGGGTAGGRSARAALGQFVTALRPNWFASVMGTGAIATVAAGLPRYAPLLRTPATVVWLLATVLLAVLAIGLVAQRVSRPGLFAAHAEDPVMAQFWGAVPMAVLTVGSGTLLLGADVIGAAAAVHLDAVAWTAGTLLGLVTAARIPYLMMTRHVIGPDAAFAGWLMPVVPPMVSASTGALLVGHLPAGQPRLTMLLACYAMFGISLMATVALLPQIWARLVHAKVGAATLVPTVWIVLGPLGQSVTAANALGTAAGRDLPHPYGAAAEAFGLFYGVPVLGFALLWATIAAAITVRAARDRLPFALTWWSFVFPLATVVTGTSALAVRGHAVVLTDLAVALAAVLLGVWLVVASATVRGIAKALRPRPH